MLSLDLSSLSLGTSWLLSKETKLHSQGREAGIPTVEVKTDKESSEWSLPSFQEGAEDTELREVSETLPTMEHNFQAGRKFPGWLDTTV